MEKIFDCLIDRYIKSKVGTAEHFLSLTLSANLKENLLGLYHDQEFLNGGTGNEVIINQDKRIRSDVIYWLDRSHHNKYENEFFDLMDKFVLYLNHTCYTGITDYEFHYALYEAGTFYQKHVDQFQNNGSRQYSMILYLNTGWEDGDGGELCIYHDDFVQSISPESGKTVFFRSADLPHEVLITHKPRMSITGWLKVSLP
ncbi:2OG-Fe(II) oxygenase [Pedobacter sp. GR22-10]|uniref:2OG-Fe(II) oxygenase n=1 Tax=Pedobacter sp. GR22-10 TaxID=2994472 RepID=UPI00224508D9|nr:2OG-Fe(II) oxygenase [Pedobacter sp. GR22-10]MCX2430855.1 2OG-Fe(II) oxygenase [Pedobacter sp. GR22-10]